MVFAIHWHESAMYYMCSPSSTPLPPPIPSHPSGSSPCTSPEHLSHANFLEEISSLSKSIGFFIPLHWSLRKAFLSLLAILWNSAFRCIYLLAIFISKKCIFRFFPHFVMELSLYYWAARILHFSGYMICIYFLSFCGLYFYFLDDILWNTKVSNFMKST